MLGMGRFSIAQLNILKFNYRSPKIPIKITAGHFLFWQVDPIIYMELQST